MALTPSTAPVAVALPAPTAAPSTTIPARSPLVLVVDDDASNRETLVEVLETEGYLVETVADGLEALEYLRRAPAPDVILLDLMMPRMDGWAFRAEQRRYPSLVTIPTIIMTASAVDTVDHECPLLRKPLALTSLLEALAMALAPAAGRARV